MRAIVLLVVFAGTAYAQPGGSDLPINTVPATTGETQPPIEYAPQPEPPPPPQLQGPMTPDMANAPTRATFISTSDAAWDVWVDRNAICATPCTLPLATNYVSVKTQERNPIRLDIGYLPPGDVTVKIHPFREGMYAGGIVATTFAGLSLATGITLTSVGYGVDNDGMKTAGLITGVAGAIGLYGGIYLMRKALPWFEF
jgi:hypothetical protein